MLERRLKYGNHMNDSSADLNVFNIILISNKIIYRIKSKAFIFNNQIYAICRTHATCVSHSVYVCAGVAQTVCQRQTNHNSIWPQRLPLTSPKQRKPDPTRQVPQCWQATKAKEYQTWLHKTSPAKTKAKEAKKTKPPQDKPHNLLTSGQSQRDKENQTSTRQVTILTKLRDKTQRQNAIGTAHQTRLAAVDLTVRAKCSCKFWTKFALCTAKLDTARSHFQTHRFELFVVSRLISIKLQPNLQFKV